MYFTNFSIKNDSMRINYGARSVNYRINNTLLKCFLKIFLFKAKCFLYYNELVLYFVLP